MQNPIEGIEPDSFEELFSRTPLMQTDQDIDQIVAKLRKDRAMWSQAEATAKPRATAASKAKPKVSLDDLDL